MPWDLATLFDDDNDNDIEMASIESHRNWHGSSSEASRPPMSELEGVFDANDDEDDDEEFPAHVSIVFVSLVSRPQKDCNQTGPRLEKTGPAVWSFDFWESKTAKRPVFAV